MAKKNTQQAEATQAQNATPEPAAATPPAPNIVTPASAAPVQAAPTGQRFLVTTANPNYTGRVYGFPIANGVGVLDITTLDPKLGHTVAAVAHELRQTPGYTLTDLGSSDPYIAIRAIREEQTAREAKEEAAISLLRDPNLAAKVKEFLKA